MTCRASQTAALYSLGVPLDKFVVVFHERGKRCKSHCFSFLYVYNLMYMIAHSSSFLVLKLFRAKPKFFLCKHKKI